MIDIKTSRIGPLTLVAATGRLDGISAGEMTTVLDDILDNQHSRIVLDLEGVNYLSAAGLRVLKHLHEKTGAVHVARPSKRVREIFQITGLNATYHSYETPLAALQAVTTITNAHTHLEGGWLAPYRPDVTGAPFVDWIVDIVKRGKKLSDPGREITYDAAIEAGIAALIDSGATAVGDISKTGRSIGPLLKSGLQGVVYVEVLGTDPAQADERLDRARKMIEAWRPQEANGMRIGLSIHTPYSTHLDLWKKALDYARRENLPLCIHVAESPAEHEYLLQGTGPFAETYYKAFDMPAVPSPKQTPVAYLEDLGALALKPLLVHAIHVSDDDLRKIKLSGSSVVHCPRSNLRLQCGRMPLEKYLAQEIPVYLGTDGLGSAPSLDVFDEVEFAIGLHHGTVRPEAIAALVHQRLPGTNDKAPSTA